MYVCMYVCIHSPPSLPPFPAASGCIPSPFDSYLANRGMKTLHVRMREHQANAMVVAKFLESSPFVTKVVYPGLPSHPQHELMKKQAKGFSGMVTFFVKGEMANVKKFFSALKVCCMCVVTWCMWVWSHGACGYGHILHVGVVTCWMHNIMYAVMYHMHVPMHVHVRK